ncbi:2-methylcitrate dehydratase [Paenibacillus psychroresistens]|uniref:2-methylcitrate dehydratase n=1 Tax=Paenibacillus psychroresistens TaxID=1778678 RepID=A0A6B8RJD8_9BACL|nr:2-methylcitrate dehydratase [Paenibacillus psychroresistens]QGQ95844.1 2-methylcitrate dehydratase [Paenibacillus psychroresistens]
MSYIRINPIIKKVNMKPKGVVEIVLETTVSQLRGSMDALGNMIDDKAEVTLDSLVVNYNVEINAKTEKPIKHYKVGEDGVVTEVIPEGEQLEADLGIPKDKQPVIEVPEEIDRKIVDEFILNLMAPPYEDLPYPFFTFAERLKDGESYDRISSDYGITAAEMIRILDEYRARIAPLANKWFEWKESQVPGTVIDNKESVTESDEPDTEIVESDQIELDKGSVGEGTLLNEEVSFNQEEGEKELVEPAAEDIESFILEKKPVFEDIPFDFPSLLAIKKSGKSWMEIATSINESSGKLGTAYTKYKKKVKDIMMGGAA